MTHNRSTAKLLARLEQVGVHKFTQVQRRGETARGEEKMPRFSVARGCVKLGIYGFKNISV
jgi:hypothetical protein